MALLTPQQKYKKIPISLRFDESLLTEIKSYNEWIGIERVEQFFEQAARYIFEKDKDWQKKSMENADENREFLKIIQLHPNLQDVVFPGTIFRQAIICVNYLCPKNLVNISHFIDKSFLALAIAKILPSISEFWLGGQTHSKWVRFWCLYHGLNNLRQTNRWKQGTEKQLVFSLRQLSADMEDWSYFTKIFHSCFGSLPYLQRFMGKFLAHCSIDVCYVYIDSIMLKHNEKYTESVRFFIKNFNKYAAFDKRMSFLVYCYRRWELFILEEENKLSYYQKPIQTSLDYSVVIYLVEHLDKEKVCCSLKEFFSKIENINTNWYKSRCDYFSHYNIILGCALLYYHALNCLNGKNKEYLPKNLLNSFPEFNHRYYEILLKAH